MSSTRDNEKEYEKICRYREGAHYCKMDLHTHTPASECSSFTLPAVIEDVLPKKPKQETRKWHDQCFQFVNSLARGDDPFKVPYNDNHLKSRPRVARRPRHRPSAIRRIAQMWRDDIRRLCPPDMERLSQVQQDQRDECVSRALVDLRNYLASLFFPEEFVLRCHIEGLQVVALTDHNHPGYIVPRRPELGTWLSALETSNKEYIRDIREGDPPGGRVRKAILERLKFAKQRLKTEFDEISNTSPTTAKQHKDHKKRLDSLAARLKHVDERFKYWKCLDNALLPLILLPGVEITVSNVHVLGLFPPKWYVPGRIASILRSIGIPEEQWGRGFLAAASASVQDTISLVDEEGGIVIPAHSNSDFKGLLRLFSGGLALTKVLEHPALLALETIGGSVIAKAGGKKAKDACETLRWLESGRFRPDRAKPLCFVKGSDAHECRIELDGTGEDLGMRFTHVKLDIRDNDTPDEIFRSLRLALLSGHSRVIESPTEDGYNYTAPKDEYRFRKAERVKLLDCDRLRPTIMGVTVSGKGAYANGLSLRFNPYLNCIVGNGGKSTIVRMIGYAFGAQSFFEKTKTAWLPKLVRVFWYEGDRIYCVEREGKCFDPNSKEIKTRWFERKPNGEWLVICKSGDPNILKLKEKVDIWPKKSLPDFEEDIIEDLKETLQFRGFAKAKPLLVIQPRNIFNSHKIFKEVLFKPLVKARQIIWSTGSPNVPTALDAEKIIVTGEKRVGKSKKLRMELICAGDLHEDDIKEQFLNHFEGGWLGFARRATIYSS